MGLLDTRRRRTPGVEPLLGPLLVHRRETQTAGVGREVDPGQAAIELFSQELGRGGRGGRMVGQEGVHQVVDVRRHERTL